VYCVATVFKYVRRITIVADGKEVITGQVNKESDEVSIWTKNQNITFVSSRFIEHEIYISKKIDRSDENENY